MSQSATREDLKETLSRILSHWGSPGASVSVVMDGRVVFLEGFGSTMAQGGVPVTPQTLAPVQSVSKAFTAVALSMLVQDGLIGWDAPVVTYVPEFEFGGSYLTGHVTVRDLMLHRAGTPFILGGWAPSAYSMTDLLRELGTSDPTIQLREGVYYSQVGMALLGEIIWRASGQTWSEFVRDRILGPLEMSGSYVDDHHLTEVLGTPDSVTGLMKTVGWSDGALEDRPWEEYDALWWPAAALITDAEQMTRFMVFLLNHGSVNGESLLDEHLVKEMFRPAELPGLDKIAEWEPIVAPRSDIVAYGPGWIAHEDFGGLIVEHGGAGRSSAVVALMPEHNLGVFVVTNASFDLESARLVSALKFAAFEHYMGLSPTDWISVLDSGN
jgi:CubicO group peptidase (beta-lactamase class C family)